MAIPVEFWKVVVLIYRIQEELKAIAYKRWRASSQPCRAPAANSRFVLGDFQNTQVSVASLSEVTGLDLAAYESLAIMAKAKGS